MTNNELKTLIKQEFGFPMVNVELHDDQLTSIISRAYKFHLKWGTGHSTQEIFFTKQLSAGVREYELPSGIQTVIEVKDYSSNLGGSQELFSLNNYMYQNFIKNITGFTLIDYELSMQFMDLLERYNTSRFNSIYHQYNNKILLSPTPSVTDITNHQFMLIRCFIEEGYQLDTTTQNPDWRLYLNDDPWFQNYCIALSKIILGHTRRKLANFTSLGNASISLDGDSLVSEGKEEKEALEEELKNSSWEGGDIFYF